MLYLILVIYGVSCMEQVPAHKLPAAVALSGAIISAVEDDIEQEEQQLQASKLEKYVENDLSWNDITNDISNFLKQNITLNDLIEGRGKFHKRHKLKKYLYHLLAGIVIAKSVVIPLVFKMLTALSASSFVMSKIALLATGLLIMKWIIGSKEVGYAPAVKERTNVDIVQVPIIKALQGHITSDSGGGWHDSHRSGSNLVSTRLHPTHPLKYIPLSVTKHENSLANYRQSHRQHNYNNFYDGKPFL